MKKTLQTAAGALLVAIGIVGWFVLDHRGETVVLALIGFGSFLVSKSTVVEFGKAAIDAVKGVRG